VDPVEKKELKIPHFPPGSGGCDRDAIASYVVRHAERIRAIARRKLPRTTRRVCDSEDVLSSVLVRLDQMAARGTLRLESERELWGLIEAIASNTAVSKVRMISRAQNLLTEDSAYAYELLKRLNNCPGDDEALLLLLRMTASLKNPVDRQVLTLMHRGASHRAIADLLGFSVDASRQRWMRIREELCARFAGGELDV
jgi:DNA-directed RNA polymerase specialized sigma24 family protein